MRKHRNPDEAIPNALRRLLRAKSTPALAGGARESALAMTWTATGPITNDDAGKVRQRSNSASGEISKVEEIVARTTINPQVLYQSSYLMEHLLIAYDILVIIIGFAALSNVVVWALRTGQGDFGNFSIVYGLLTLLMVIRMLEKYLLVNVAAYSPQTWYYISNVHQVIDYAIIMAAFYLFIDPHQFHHGRRVAAVFLLLMFLSDGLIFSPFGMILDAENNIVRFGTGYWIAGGWSTITFTCAIVLGYWLLVRVWNTDKRIFTIGLLVFASIGYLEMTSGFLRNISVKSAPLTIERGFIYSSIPYVLYGIFLIVYFARYPVSAPVANEEPSHEFLSKYGITDREREIILMVMQGKSNEDIARELVISLGTVKTHLHNIYKKAGIDSRYDLLAKARLGQ